MGSPPPTAREVAPFVRPRAYGYRLATLDGNAADSIALPMLSE
ncbi:hypothetical protein [Mycobacterium parmense]|nr:hypothetical protein [Mycobacterium parmense]